MTDLSRIPPLAFELGNFGPSPIFTNYNLGSNPYAIALTASSTDYSFFEKCKKSNIVIRDPYQCFSREAQQYFGAARAD